MKYANNKSGIIVINKPTDMTSRDVVNIVTRELKVKAGHTGTLDPMATGVLIICLGKATKLVEAITSEDKEYEAEVILGIETDTLDTEGKILKQETSLISKENILKALTKFKTTYNQEVPKYSAVKINGKKLYEYARNNQEVELPKKTVTIYELDLLDYKQENNQTIFKIHTKVSKGTYIRSLIRDIGYELNTIGTMSKLIRTKQGKFTIKDTYTLEDLKNNNYKILNISDVVDYKIIKVDDELKFKILNGQKLQGTENVLYQDKEGKDLAIYKHTNDELRMWKMLYEETRENK